MTGALVLVLLLVECVAGAAGIHQSRLYGRFLHITDLHIDPQYVSGAPLQSHCHQVPNANKRQVASDGFGDGGGEGAGELAGYWGSPRSQCDSPTSLFDAALRWLSQHWAHEIDFVIWTGDSARHDLDPEHFPRNLSQVFSINRLAVERMKSVFPDIPIVPSIGNNDVDPHDVQSRGPSLTIRGLAKVWEDFIPRNMHHSFLKGAYYSVDVVPNTLAVISLNSNYFYESNSAVQGCADRSVAHKDPGTEQLHWLKGQLHHYRSRGMQVHIIGHVPPRVDTWYLRCYEKYGSIVLKYHDMILGQHFGHANIDHFSVLDAHEFTKKEAKQEKVTITKDLDQLTQMFRSVYKRIAKKKHTHDADYVIVHTAPSVVPAYLPAIRVWIYNVTQASRHDTAYSSQPTAGWLRDPISRLVYQTLEGQFRSLVAATMRSVSHTRSTSASKINTFLTPLAYTQFTLDLDVANLNKGKGPKSTSTHFNEAHPTFPPWQIEYSTATRERFADSILGIGEEPTLFSKELSPAKYVKLDSSDAIIHELIKDRDRDRRRLDRGDKSQRRVTEEIVDDDDGDDMFIHGDGGKEGEGELHTNQRDLVPWQMQDLTIGSWLHVAKRLAKYEIDWKRYLELMFVSSGAEP